MTTLPFEVQCTHRAPLRAESRRRLRLVLGISAAVMVAEAVGGYAPGSLALLAGAGHMVPGGAGPGPVPVGASPWPGPPTAPGPVRVEAPQTPPPPAKPAAP